MPERAPGTCIPPGGFREGTSKLSPARSFLLSLERSPEPGPARARTWPGRRPHRKEPIFRTDSPGSRWAQVYIFRVLMSSYGRKTSEGKEVLDATPCPSEAAGEGSLGNGTPAAQADVIPDTPDLPLLEKLPGIITISGGKDLVLGYIGANHSPSRSLRYSWALTRWRTEARA